LKAIHYALCIINRNKHSEASCSCRHP
jgi:hypothetical protein